MLLTICLVTKGREDFLPELLVSFETVFKYNYVKFLIIDNGSEAKVEKILNKWAIENCNKVTLFRFDNNDSRLSSYWSLIRSNSDDWIIFPGDDDEFCEDIVTEWFNTVNGNSAVVGFAATSQIISSDGKSTNQKISPRVHGIDEYLERLAISLHHPPYNWPALFFKTSALPKEVPSSRFAFDWWVGVNLQLSGQVLTTKSIAVKYRRHSSQESQVVPLRRKNLESYIWLSNLMDQKNFICWVKNLTDSEKITFWRNCITYPPIYGDSIFSVIILSKLYGLLSKSIIEHKFLSELIQSYSYSHGVLLYKNQITNLTNVELSQELCNESNYFLNVDEECCEKLKIISRQFIPSINTSKYDVVCEHSFKTSKEILIKCSDLSNDDEVFNFDMISKSITDYLEANGHILFSLSPAERKILIYLRKLKTFLPKNIFNLLNRIIKKT